MYEGFTTIGHPETKLPGRAIIFEDVVLWVLRKQCWQNLTHVLILCP